MKKTELLEKSILIRETELKLLDLFSKGKINGTIHTCIGQEYSGALLDLFNDINYNVFSNHRSHGHYIGKTGDVQGLINEIVGSKDGVVGGFGGSQHIHNKGFFSNGILAGMAPVSAGYSFATNNLSILFIGDGALGEGIFYETLNLIKKFNLKILIVFEDNKIAQSTNSNQTFFGDIQKRIEGFGLNYKKNNIWDLDNLIKDFQNIKKSINENYEPLFFHVECYRLKAHSKGDDTRDIQEIKKYEDIDPINIFKSEQPNHYNEIKKNVNQLIDKFTNNIVYENNIEFEDSIDSTKVDWEELSIYSDELINKRIYESFLSNLESNKDIYIFGEDIEFPYGGAFKVTKDLSKLFPNNVFNMPDSEAAIVGFGNGVSISNKIAICEIMFADFLSLIFDQWLNHATKFNKMYHERINNKIIVRTAVGGRRGYGPTHSQNTEKYFLGIPGSQIISLNYLYDPKLIYDQLIKNAKHPTLVFENKLDYARHNKKINSSKFRCYISNEKIPMLKISNINSDPDVIIVAWGGLVSMIEEAIENVLSKDEIVCEVLIPQKLYPLNISPIVDSLKFTKKLLIIEDDTSFGSLGSEIISLLKNKLVDFDVKKINTYNQLIPNSKTLEDKHYPNIKQITQEIVKFYLK